MKTIAYAPDAWRLLNGIFCVFKPAGLSIKKLRQTLAFNLCRDLNDVGTRPPSDLVKIEGSYLSGESLSVKLVPNFADNVLVTGPRYQIQDVRLRWVTNLGFYSSGVLAMAVNRGCGKIRPIHEANVIRKVEVKGEFGFATDTFMPDGKVIEKATYGHITEGLLVRRLEAIQVAHQADSFAFSGYDIQSQQAYEVAASKGNVRPHGKSPPLIYSMKLTRFDLPYFTIELTCVNETEEYLCALINQIGIYLKSCAVCCQLRQLQYGPFTLDHALLRKHWTLEHILSNIVLCNDLSDFSKIIPSSPHFHQVPKSEIQEKFHDIQKQKRENYLQ